MQQPLGHLPDTVSGGKRSATASLVLPQFMPSKVARAVESPSVCCQRLRLLGVVHPGTSAGAPLGGTKCSESDQPALVVFEWSVFP